MAAGPWKITTNGQVVAIADVPELDLDEWRSAIIAAREPIAALFGEPGGDGIALWCVLALPSTGQLGLLRSRIRGTYRSLTPSIPGAHYFEREIAEQCGVVPEGHPWLKPVRFTGVDVEGPAVTRFFTVDGEEIHEVAVGPVHAGVIEPGHFRFQCHGERVLHLEIALGYQHRGVERALRAGPDKRSIHYAETLAGDTTLGHATAYCEAVEALGGGRPSLRGMAIRALGLELERMANHTGDLGALAGDVGYLPTMSYCGRLRGDFLNMTGAITGNRFGRGLARPGGAGHDLDADMVADLLRRLDGAMRDLAPAVDLLWNTSSVLSRFEGTGVVSRQTATELGLVGVAARACGIKRDVRHDLPSGFYRFSQVPVATGETGDVFARAHVRWQELENSAEFIRQLLADLPEGQARNEPPGGLRSDAVVVTLVEGWRGQICHIAMTDGGGRFAHYKVVDPSFHNWTGLAVALRDQAISDFPLCNKSFNLSYCGHDL